MNTCIVQKDWRMRTVEERDELYAGFMIFLYSIDSDNRKILVGKKDMVLPQDQAYFMQRYLNILNQRIEKFS